MPQRDSEDTPITSGALMKWAGIAFTAVSLLASAILYASNTRQIVDQNTKDIIRVDDNSKQRHEQQEREIIEIKTGTSEHQKLLIELLRKSDVLAQKVDELGKKIDGKGTN